MANIAEKFFKPSERTRIWQVFLLIILLSMLAGAVDANVYYNRGVDWLSGKTSNKINLPYINKDFRLGLDLQGGTHLVYRADVSAIPDKDQASAVEGVRDVIERRVNVFGVSEPVVQTNSSGGEYRVIVELAGISDVNQAIEMIGETPLLEFKEESQELKELTDEEKQNLAEFNKKAEEVAEEVLGKVIEGGDFSSLANEYSQDPKNTNEDSTKNGGDMGWVTEGSDQRTYNLVKDFEKGQTSLDLIETPTGYEILKLEDRRIKANPFTGEEEKEIHASHLLICFEGADRCEYEISKEEALSKIEEIKSKATPANFVELVKENSTEPGAEQTGGDLGFFGRGAMTEAFEKAVYSQEVGTISGPVETEFGYHLIYKQEERVIEELKVNHIFIGTISESDLANNLKDWKITELTGKNLERATVQFNQNDGSPEVSLEFDGEGAKLFEEITERNVNKQVAIFLDGYAISSPVVNEKITGGKAVISGKFNIKEAKLLAQRLNAGALPVPINLISQQTVGASLGKQSVNDSLRAGLIGLILVALFMVVVYRLPGLLAVISLSIYGILVLAVIKLWPVTLTLSGLAGFILSVGMAVDANVLIFARLKEELNGGKPLALAIEEAFRRAWPSIRDGNVSTLLTCFILIQFTTSVVKGFAITLGLGILVSMFSAIIITKNLLNLTVGPRLEKLPWLFGVKEIMK